jgi:AhpD family alkylhydroperoxidase
MSRLGRVGVDQLAGRLTSKYADDVLAMDPLSVLYGTLGNSPPMLSAWVDFAWTLRYEPIADRALRELLILLVGSRRSAPYCINAHLRMAAEEGVEQEKIDALTHWSAASCYSPTERACLDLADAMLSGSASDQHLAAVVEVLDEERAIEVVLTVGFYIMVAAVTTTLDLHPA